MRSRKAPFLGTWRAWCCLLLLTLALPVAPTLLVTSAQAQERSSGGGILRFLFQRNEPQKQQRVAPPAPRKAAPTRRTPRPPVEPVTPAIEKAADAQRVLVVGDFMANGLAEGLATAYAEEAKVVIVERANGSSGLVRDDHYDWPQNLASVIDTEKPSVVVVMIGSNDRQQMLVAGTRENPRTEAWTTEYERRATALAKVVRAKSLPLIWVGNLPFRPGGMSSDMIAFNDMFRRIVADAGGEFVDVWDGFVDETGAFAANGPDMNGQPAQLRASDGINITRQGRRKLAFYVEKPLGRLLDLTQESPGVKLIDPEELIGPLPGEPGDTTPAEIVRTAPVSINDLGGDSSGLLGASFTRPSRGVPQTAGERLIREGIVPVPTPGRADDFTVRRPMPASPETTTSTTP